MRAVFCLGALLLPEWASGHGSLVLSASRASEGVPTAPTLGRGGSSGVGCLSGACHWYNIGCKSSHLHACPVRRALIMSRLLMLSSAAHPPACRCS